MLITIAWLKTFAALLDYQRLVSDFPMSAEHEDSEDLRETRF